MKATEQLSAAELPFAATLLKRGELVAFPTETVYGLGAGLFLPEAVRQIFTVKGRPSDNPLIAHVSSIFQVEEIARDIPPVFYRLAERFFPGPLTVVLKRHPEVPALISAGLDTIAIRMPAHSLAQELIKLAGMPLVAPSANLSGKPSATCVAHVMEDFNGKIAAVIDGGECTVGIESTVLSLLDETPVLLRPGSISCQDLEDYLGMAIKVTTTAAQDPAVSPGMKYRHYCPQTPIRLFHSLEEIGHYLKKGLPQSRMLLARDEHSFSNIDFFPLNAKKLYAWLRLADQKSYEEILILIDEETQKESGLLNRLLRAAGIKEA